MTRAPLPASGLQGDATGGTYRPALDGLRAIAVTGVLYAHFWNEESLLGHYGVRLFFVLSGFLITGILVGLRDRAGRHGIGPTYGIFLARRALRLWPAYYLLLALLLAADAGGIRGVAWWHLLHGSNFLFALEDAYRPWLTAHYWSLSVEEQFYLVWPLIVLTLPRRWLRPAIVATILAGILFRGAAFAVASPGLFHAFFPLASFDALGAGALLALQTIDGRPMPRWAWVAAGAGLAAVVLTPVAGWVDPVRDLSGWTYLGVETLAVPAMAVAVAVSARPRPGTTARLLSVRPLVAVGRISYGVYLYHLLALWAVLRAAGALDLAPPEPGPLRFMLAGALTLLLAWLSWACLERPLRRLKRRLPYRAAATPARWPDPVVR